MFTNELITNALKYAWEGRKGEGTIIMRAEQQGDQVIFSVGDDGIGLPDKFEKMQTDTLELQLVATLAEQLDAVLKVSNSKGAKF